MSYLLLTKHSTHSTPCEVNFEIFDKEEDATQKIASEIRQTLAYGPMAGLIAPRLLEAVVLKVEVVFEAGKGQDARQVLDQINSAGG